jgi:beta-lactamase regulating signal transducer with metallopeptidase domain
LAAALNFVLPFGAVLDGLFAPSISWATPLGVIGGLGAFVSANNAIAGSLAAAWLIGAAAMLARLCVRVAAQRRGARMPVDKSIRSFRAPGVRVSFAVSSHGPAVDGLLRSRILLPLGIDRVLSKRELHSVIVHELTHAKRHDNFIRLLYEIALCALWFHPLFWITGSRLALYRELSCDESVIERGHGVDLVSALAKLANPDEGPLLEANAGSLLSHRLTRLAGAQISRVSVAANALSATCFAAVFMTGVFATVAHTACCFVART